MPSQSLARIMYGTNQQYSLAAVASTPLAPSTNPSDHLGPRPETIAEVLSRAWARLVRKH
jgi:hypothetical protein